MPPATLAPARPPRCVVAAPSSYVEEEAGRRSRAAGDVPEQPERGTRIVPRAREGAGVDVSAHRARLVPAFARERGIARAFSDPGHRNCK